MKTAAAIINSPRTTVSKLVALGELAESFHKRSEAYAAGGFFRESDEARSDAEMVELAADDIRAELEAR